MARSLPYLLAATLATALFFVAPAYLGPLAAPLVLAVPFPAAYVHMRFGLRSGVLTAAAGAALVFYLAGPGEALECLLLFGCGSILLPVFLRRGVPWDRATAGTTVCVLAVVTFLGMAAAWQQGKGINDLLREHLRSEADRALALVQAADPPADQLVEFQKALELVVEWGPGIATGVIAAFLVLSLLVLTALLAWAARGRYAVPGIPFEQWKLPEPLVWGLIAGGFLALAPWPAARIAAFNLLVLLLPLYFLQGLAVLAAFLARKGVPPVFRRLICVLAVLLNPLPLILTGVGIFDLWVDFRKPRKKEK